MTPIIGTWQLGGSSWATVDQGLADRAIEQAIRIGFREFDTAPTYGDGASEARLGQALRNAGVKDAIITTKVPPDRLRFDSILASVEGSLERLGTQQVDTVLIHWPSGTMGTEKVASQEAVAGLRAVKERGLARRIGVSNFNLEELKDIHEQIGIEVAQYSFSPLFRAVEFGILEYLKNQRIEVQGYSSFAQGLLSPRNEVVRPGADDHRNWVRLFREPFFSECLRVRSALWGRFGASKFSGACVDWIRSCGVRPIVGVHRPEHLEVLQSVPTQLSEVDAEFINVVSAPLKSMLGPNVSMWGD